MRRPRVGRGGSGGFSWATGPRTATRPATRRLMRVTERLIDRRSEPPDVRCRVDAEQCPNGNRRREAHHLPAKRRRPNRAQGDPSVGRPRSVASAMVAAMASTAVWWNEGWTRRRRLSQRSPSLVAMPWPSSSMNRLLCHGTLPYRWSTSRSGSADRPDATMPSAQSACGRTDIALLVPSGNVGPDRPVGALALSRRPRRRPLPTATTARVPLLLIPPSIMYPRSPAPPATAEFETHEAMRPNVPRQG